MVKFKYRLKEQAEKNVEEFNRKAAEIAKSVCPENKFVFGSIGPTGEFLEPLGNVTEKEMENGFERQLNGLIEGGVDGTPYLCCWSWYC